jgi:hypothetical protein
MMRRTPLNRGTKPLRRTTRLRARGNTAYRRRERDVPYMLWVKRQPCMLRQICPHPSMPVGFATTPCEGRVEADHMGARGTGQKADDRTCVPMCRRHHSERHAHAGTFFSLTRDDLRAWRTAAIERTQAAWSAR